jgi:ribosomal protein S18 acetylase RimI-like enzyme
MSLFENIQIVNFETDKDLEKYVIFKKEFLSDIWSEKYGQFFKKNFKVLDNQLLLIAKVKNIIVGQLFISFKQNIAYIEEIEISLEFQNNNLGKNLINRFKQIYPNTSIELRVEKSNINAISFYEKLGFYLKKNEGNFLLFTDGTLEEAA